MKRRRVSGLDVLEIKGDQAGPTIILFHGFGADAEDLAPLSSLYSGNIKPTWIFPNGPNEVEIAPGYFGRAWFEINLALLQKAVRDNSHEELLHAFPHDLTKVRELAENLIEELHIPHSKLILGGFSQGAILATEIALHQPTNIAALIVLSGTLYNEAAWKKLMNAHHGLHFFQSHGIEDPILPYKGAKALESLFHAEKFAGKLHTFHGRHEIPEVILHELQKFLKERVG